MNNSYDYNEYGEYNRFTNLDGIEAKIISSLINLQTPQSDLFWKVLKYNTKDALLQNNVSKNDRIKMVDGYGGVDAASETTVTRVFLSPFTNDAWDKEETAIYIYINGVQPINNASANVDIVVETVVHSKINTIIGDADLILHPNITNINDYLYKDMENPQVCFKSRSTVLLKTLLAMLNGLYLDGIGYLEFGSTEPLKGGNKLVSKVEMQQLSGRPLYGHKIHFNMSISGVDNSDAIGEEW